LNALQKRRAAIYSSFMATIADVLAMGVRNHQTGNLSQAEQLYRQVLQANPAHPHALYLLGMLALQVGQSQAAVDLLGRAVALAPHVPEFHATLAAAYATLGRTEEAIASCRQVLALRPDSPDAHFNLGNVLNQANRLQEAADTFRMALRLHPQCAEMHSNLGNILRGEGKLDEAVRHCREALRLRPDLPEAHSNLGLALRDLDRLDEAIACYQAALSHRPEFADAHYNLGIALTDRGELPEAEASLREAVRLAPADLEIHSRLLFTLNYNPELTPAELLTEHRRWAEVCGTRPVPNHANSAQPERRLRIGYSSADFFGHPVATFVEPILRYHNAQQFEIFCYADVARPDATTERLRPLAHVWRPTRGLSDARLIEMIRADGVDLLVDLAGHTPCNRLPVFACKPAPIQITYLGYPATTGLPAIDYRLTDVLMDPPGEPVCQSEELWRLPGSFWCQRPREDAPAVGPLPARRAGHITFGSTGGLPKLNARVLELWARLLQALPQGRLLLFRHSLTGFAAERLLGEFERHGVDRPRIELRNQRPQPGPAGHLSVYQDMDLVLDTFPVGGHTTTCEAVWMGVPVLTLYGDRYAARLASSVLTGVGLEDWSARSPDEFVERGVRLATDLDGLEALRSTLRERMAKSPLCDAPGFTHRLEQAYREMWRRWCARQR
jgi:predicted O-linked N-acetylglucosamine transferase (SPINDLY family)